MLLTLAFSAIGLVLLVLFVPVDVQFQVRRQPEWSYRVGARWLFGLVAGHGEEATPSPPVSVSSFEGLDVSNAPRSRGGGRKTHVIAMLRSPGFVGAIARLARRLLGAVRIRELSLWLRAGFEDPADTGIMCGWLVPISSCLDANVTHRLDIAPDFSGETLRLAADGDVRILPVNLVWPILVVGLSPGVWRGLRAMRRGSSV